MTKEGRAAGRRETVTNDETLKLRACIDGTLRKHGYEETSSVIDAIFFLIAEQTERARQEALCVREGAPNQEIGVRRLERERAAKMCTRIALTLDLKSRQPDIDTWHAMTLREQAKTAYMCASQIRTAGEDDARLSAQKGDAK
jgi:hypothetical protein